MADKGFDINYLYVNVKLISIFCKNLRSPFLQRCCEDMVNMLLANCVLSYLVHLPDFPGKAHFRIYRPFSRWNLGGRPIETFGDPHDFEVLQITHIHTCTHARTCARAHTHTHTHTHTHASKQTNNMMSIVVVPWDKNQNNYRLSATRIY